MANYIKGQNFIVFAGSTSSSGRVAYSRSCSIEIKVNTIEVSDQNTGEWRNFIPGKMEWAISVSGLVASGRNDLTLWNLLKDHAALTVYYEDVDTGKMWTGSAILVQLTQNAELHQTTTYSAKFQGTGELTDK